MELLRYDDDTALVLADSSATIARIVRTVPADKLRATRFGEWTAVELLGHLADAAEIFADRVERCIEEDLPAIASYDQDAVAAERRNAERDPLGSRSASWWRTAAWSSCSPSRSPLAAGVHGEWGVVDAGHFAAYQAKHAGEHTGELAKAFPPTA